MKPNFIFRILSVALIFLLALQGCTYQGKIRRGIYNHRDFKEKIPARVMVVADKFYREKIYLDNEHIYSFRLKDGLPIAVADALGTLFTEVEVNNYEFRKEYDYIVEIEYKGRVDLGNVEYRREGVLAPNYVLNPTLDTRLILTFRNPHTGYAVARYDENVHTLLPTDRIDTLLKITNILSSLSLGILYPLDLQIFGMKVRNRIEKNVTYCLYKKIMPAIKEDRVNYQLSHETEQTNTRVDGALLPFMHATLFLHTTNGTGSGFLISPDGYIITNHHVVGKDRDVAVVFYDQRHLLDKAHPIQKYSQENLRAKVRFGKVIKTNKRRDLALVKIEGENLPYLELEQDRTQYATGQEVVAIGAPLGIEWSVSHGIISAVRNTNGVDTLQTDAAINGGNSGGPLIAKRTGKVLGVNSWGRVSTSFKDQAESLNFAISAYEVLRTLGISQPIDEDMLAMTAD